MRIRCASDAAAEGGPIFKVQTRSYLLVVCMYQHTHELTSRLFLKSFCWVGHRVSNVLQTSVAGSGAIPALVSAMGANMANVMLQEQACLLLANLAKQHADNQSAIHLAGGHALVTTCLRLFVSVLLLVLVVCVYVYVYVYLCV